ncbi:MAG: hypothetical protein ACI3ZQ_07435 [Candidatus Cryptobacteroides sp.]
MKKLKYIFLSVCAFAAVACNTDNVGAIYTGAESIASFPTAKTVDEEVDMQATEYLVPLRRQTNKGELTVSVTASELPDEIKIPETSVTFADGEFETAIKLDITDIVVGQKYTAELALDEKVSSANVGYNTHSVVLARAYKWESIGMGQYIDLNFVGLVVDVEFRKAEGFELYRAYNPYPKELLTDPEIMGDDVFPDSGAWGVGGDACEYIEYSLVGDSILWNNYSTTIDYDGNGSTIYCMRSPASGTSEGFVDENRKVIEITPFLYIPALGGGFGVQGANYLSLPGGPDLEKFLFGE